MRCHSDAPSASQVGRRNCPLSWRPKLGRISRQCSLSSAAPAAPGHRLSLSCQKLLAVRELRSFPSVNLIQNIPLLFLVNHNALFITIFAYDFALIIVLCSFVSYTSDGDCESVYQDIKTVNFSISRRMGSMGKESQRDVDDQVRRSQQKA